VNGGPTGDLFSYQAHRGSQPGNEQLVVESQRIIDPIGFQKNRPGSGRVLAGRMLEILGDWTVVQFEVTEGSRSLDVCIANARAAYRK
jgi:hypothetical protein